MTNAKLHKIYAVAIALVVVVAIVVGVSWTQHVRDDAKRDAVIDAQKSDIADLEKHIDTTAAAAQAKVADLEKQKQVVKADPAQARMIIGQSLSGLKDPNFYDATTTLTRGTTPVSIPATPQPQASPAIETTPDAKPMMLTQQDQQDLAQFILTCKECDAQKTQLLATNSDQAEIITRQKTELDASLKAAKGGSVWQRTKRAAKWIAVAGGVGYAIGRAQR